MPTKNQIRGDKMDLNFLKGLMSEGETVAGSGSSNMVLLRTPDGDLTFTFENDDRLEGAFQGWEKLCLLTPEQHQSTLELMNNCEWDKKVEYQNESLVKIERYSVEEKNRILAEKAIQEKKSFYNSEKQLALEIEEDYRLGLEDVTEEEMLEVKIYIKNMHQSLQPTKATVIEIVRPKIMIEYEERKQNEVL